MTVSNEDRRLAKNAVDDVLNEWYEENGVGVSTRIVLNATIVNALVSHGWGPRRQIQIETLMEARDAAREARRICWAENRDEHVIRHWGATAGWMASRARKIEAGDEPDWPDAANSASVDEGLELTDGTE